MGWPTPSRRSTRSLCGCGQPRSVEVLVRAATRGGGYSQLGSVSRTLCETCALRVFGAASDEIKRATQPVETQEAET